MTTNRLLLLTILEGIYDMQDKIDKLRAASERQTTVVQSVVTFMQGLPQVLRDSADDPEEIEAIAAQIEANTDAVAQAMVANTPAEADETGDTGGATGATGGAEE